MSGLTQILMTRASLGGVGGCRSGRAHSCPTEMVGRNCLSLGREGGRARLGRGALPHEPDEERYSFLVAVERLPVTKAVFVAAVDDTRLRIVEHRASDTFRGSSLGSRRRTLVRQSWVGRTRSCWARPALLVAAKSDGSRSAWLR